MGDGGKGDGRRPRFIDAKEEDLRWQLWLTEDEEEKAEIRKQLERLEALHDV